MFDIRWLQNPEARRFLIDRTTRPWQLPPSRRKRDGIPPPRQIVMRLAHVIIKLKTRPNLVESLLASQPRVPFAGHMRAGHRHRQRHALFDQAL